ncbi:hypothetical protein GXM_07848 [Nostoc sphaeroides CCNUC1]|uniref:Uncharacterized protein n=1 Tax=Nostoc sphaeroides CCNUC1 TaxID=2653204 RepID=A0A5P8WCJ7_9NOSO|nr:hypothetical protein GXM_07848 [Nostoc sphaeroides CCNUC1]
MFFAQSPVCSRALSEFLGKMNSTKKVYQASFHLAKLYSKEG